MNSYFWNMLQSLHISNYAIIDELEVNFSSGMNVITGETGAGKSILLGALSMVLGERADTKVMLDESRKCIVEVVFDNTESLDLSAILDEYEADAQVILRREIAPNGKSRSFINDSPATLNQLKAVGELLVNIHTQHETLDLVGKGFQMNVLDVFAGIKNQSADFSISFSSYKKLVAELNELKANAQKIAQEEEFLKFQFDELAAANLTEGEQEELENEVKRLTNVEGIKAALSRSAALLDADEYSILSLLGSLSSELKSVTAFDENIQKELQRIISVKEELSDIQHELDRLNENLEHDPARLEEATARLNSIYRLQKKHGKNSITELLELQTELESKLKKISNLSGDTGALEQKCTTTLLKLKKQAKELHEVRAKHAPKAATQVTKLLQQMGMPNATFDIAVNELDTDKMNQFGTDEVVFLFTANKGFAPKPLKDVASGGELSRLMLAVKSLLSGADHTPTMIFDEIDTGISGEVALRVGDIMNQIAAKHQLICITHLPQIARCGDAHYFVFKSVKNGKSTADVKLLSLPEREAEIAKMIGGENYSQTALSSARELMQIK
jgi:DNA repair protein RecN (Recombination protein N)